MSGQIEKFLYKVVKGKFREHLKASVINQLYSATKFSNLTGYMQEVSGFIERISILVPHQSTAYVSKLASELADAPNNRRTLEVLSLSQRHSNIPSATEVLFALFNRRKTVRKFSNKPLTIESVTTILEGCYKSRVSECEENEAIRNHSVPSGGALYPLNLYLFAYHVGGLTRGVYLYNSHNQTYERLRDISDYPIDQFHAPPSPVSPAAGILITYNVSKNYFKYASLGFKLALLEAGHVGQNILLLATSLDIKTFPSCGVHESKICKILGIDEAVEYPVYTIWLGR